MTRIRAAEEERGFRGPLAHFDSSSKLLQVHRKPPKEFTAGGGDVPPTTIAIVGARGKPERAGSTWHGNQSSKVAGCENSVSSHKDAAWPCTFQVDR